MAADLTPQGAAAVRLAATVVQLTAERDRARDIAVGLEQRLARVEALEQRLWADPDCELGCIHVIAFDIRGALGAEDA